MLVPYVLTYVVPPPSAVGRNSQAAASSSATRALSFAVRTAVRMIRLPDRVRRGGRSAAPPAPDPSVEDREADEVERVEVGVRGRRVADDVHRAGGVGTRGVTGDGGDHGGALLEGQRGGLVLDVGARVEGDRAQVGVVRRVGRVVDVGHGRTGDGALAVTRDAGRDHVRGGEGGAGHRGGGETEAREGQVGLTHRSSSCLLGGPGFARSYGCVTRSSDGRPVLLTPSHRTVTRVA